MSNETEAGTQTLASSSDKIDWRLRQEQEMNSQETEPSASELTVRSVEGLIKQATDPILRRVEEIRALLARRTDLESDGNTEASSTRCDNTFTGPSSNRHDSFNEILDEIFDKNDKYNPFFFKFALKV